MVVGSTILWARSDREVVDLLKDGQLVLICSLGDAVAEAAGAVARLSSDTERTDAGLGRPRGRRSARCWGRRSMPGTPLASRSWEATSCGRWSDGSCST